MSPHADDTSRHPATGAPDLAPDLAPDPPAEAMPDLSAARLWVPDTRSRAARAGEHKPRVPLILAIDDSPAIRTIVEYSFRRVGVRVMTFGDGLEAIRALAERRVSVPDLVLLDVGLPRLGGYEVAAVLRTNEALSTTPIVMLSGRDGIVDRMRSRMVGATTFIAKPFRPKHLVTVVCDLMGITPASPAEPPEER